MAVTALSGQRWQGRTYTSWDFDGSNDYVQLTEKFNFLHNGNNGSIALWIYMTDYPSSVDGAMFDTHGGQSTSVGVAFGIRQSSGKLYANILADGDSWYVAESASAITKDAWHHVVYTYDGSDINLYLDGNSTPVGTVSAGSPKTASASNDAVLGKQIVTGYTDGFYNGLCDQLLIYDDILTTGEISALYNSGNADHTPNESNLEAWYNFEQTGSTLTDQTSNGYDGTNNGATTGTTGVFPDDKDSVTDVPVGSEFEQTDDYKSYQRAGGSTIWTQTTNNDAINVQYGTSDQTSKLGQKFESGHANVGKIFTQVTVKLKRYNGASATHLIYCKVYDASGSARATATTTYEMKDLTTTNVDKIFTFATPITIAVNETVGFESNGGAYDVEMFNFRVNSTSVEANTYLNDYRNGGWQTTFSSWDMYMILDKSASWVERGTAI